MEPATKQNQASAVPKKQGNFFGQRKEASFFSPAFIQPKLTIGPVDDPYEREADAIADRVMRMSDTESLQTKPSPVTVQRKCAACEEEEKVQRKCEHCEDEESIIPSEEDEEIQMKRSDDFDIQRKCTDCEEEEKKSLMLKRDRGVSVQRKCTACDEENKIYSKRYWANGGLDVPGSVYQALNATGHSLDKRTRVFMEQRFGYDFGNVVIHNDAISHKSSAEIGALAYTQGDHIVFGAGQYQPDQDRSRQLLAHELSHVIQQATGSHLQTSITSFNSASPASLIQRCDMYIDCGANDSESDPEASEEDVPYPDPNCQASSPEDEDFIPKSNTTALINSERCDNVRINNKNEEKDGEPITTAVKPPCDIAYPEQTQEAILKIPEAESLKKEQHIQDALPEKSFDRPDIQFFPKESKSDKVTIPEEETTIEDELYSEEGPNEFRMIDAADRNSMDHGFGEDQEIFDLPSLSAMVEARLNTAPSPAQNDSSVSGKISPLFISDTMTRINDFVQEGMDLQNYIDLNSSTKKSDVTQFIDQQHQHTEIFFDQLINSAKFAKNASKVRLRSMYSRSFKKLNNDYDVTLRFLEEIQTNDSQNIRDDLKVRLSELNEVYKQTSDNMRTIGKNAGDGAISRAKKWYAIYDAGWGFGQEIKDKILGNKTDGFLEGVELTKRKFRARANVVDKVGREFKWGIYNQIDHSADKLSCSCPKQEEGIKDAHSKTAASMMCFQELAYRNLGESELQYYNLAVALKTQSLEAIEDSWKDTDKQLRKVKQTQLSLLTNSRDTMLDNIGNNALQLKANVSLGITVGVTLLMENLDKVRVWQSNGQIPDKINEEEIARSFYEGIAQGRSDIIKIYQNFDSGINESCQNFFQSVTVKTSESEQNCIPLTEKFEEHIKSIEQHSSSIYGKVNSAAKNEFELWKAVYEEPMRALRPNLELQTKNSISVLNEKLCDILKSTEEGLQNVLSRKGPFDKAMICAAQQAADSEVEAFVRGFRYLKYVIIGALLGIAIILSGGLAAVGAVGFFAISGVVLGMALIGAVSSALITIVENIANGRPIGEGVLKSAGVGAITGLFGGIGGFIFKGGTIASIIGSMGLDIGSGIVADLLVGNEISLAGILTGAAIGIGVGLSFTKFASFFPRSERLDRFFKKLEGKLNRGVRQRGASKNIPGAASVHSDTIPGQPKIEIDTFESAAKPANIDSPAVKPTATTPDVEPTTFDRSSAPKDIDEALSQVIGPHGEKPTPEILQDIADDMEPLLKRVQNQDNIKQVEAKFAEDYDVEVKVGDHTFRRNKESKKWCRFSDPYCKIESRGDLNEHADQFLKTKAAKRSGTEPVEIDPKARGYAIEDYHLSKLRSVGWEGLPDFYPRVDALKGGSSTKDGAVRSGADVLSVKSTRVTEPKALLRKLNEDISALSGKVFTNKRGTLTIKNVKQKILHLVFEQGFLYKVDDPAVLKLLKDFKRQAAKQGVTFEWFVIPDDGSIRNGPAFFREQSDQVDD